MSENFLDKLREHTMYNAIMERIETAVRTAGECVMAVHPDENNPSMTYTIGASLYGAPEAYIAGLAPDQSHVILSDYCDRAKNGTLEFDHETGLVKDSLFGNGYQTAFRLLKREPAEKKFLIKTYQFARLQGWLEFESIQLIWPDPSGKMPWENGFNISSITHPNHVDKINVPDAWEKIVVDHSVLH